LFQITLLLGVSASDALDPLMVEYRLHHGLPDMRTGSLQDMRVGSLQDVRTGSTMLRRPS
jgi:hypothetical protein